MKRLHRHRSIPLLALLWILGTASAASAEGGTCAYDLSPIEGSFETVRIKVRCDQTVGDAGFQSRADGKYWRIEAERNEMGESRFVLDLGAMARELGDFRSAMPYGDGFLVSPSLLLPLPRIDDMVLLKVRFSATGSADNVVSALRADPDENFTLTNRGIDETGPILLGTNLKVEALSGDPELRLAVPAQGLSLAREEIAAWVSAAAESNRRFWGKSPVVDGLVVIVSAAGRNGVPFGRVMSEGGPVVTILLGQNADGGALYEDWVLAHELLHLGTPIMRDTGTWLNEGIATFYEPPLRARAGWKTEDDVWREWISQMPRGLRAMTDIGLSNAGRGGIYWGGAVFVLLAEIEALRASGGATGFSDCLREALAQGGDATQRWPTRKLIAICDQMLGTDRLSQLLAAHVDKGSPVDLAGLWLLLGVSMAQDGAISYDDSAELAWMRPLIIWGGTEKPDAISSAGFQDPE